jgi:predicted metalloprotease
MTLKSNSTDISVIQYPSLQLTHRVAAAESGTARSIAGPIVMPSVQREAFQLNLVQLLDEAIAISDMICKEIQDQKHS